MKITDTQKQIYNLYLKSLGVNNNRPFRYKKDFSDIENSEEKLQYLAKIEAVFNKYPAFFGSIYFDAPYKILGKSEKYFPLKFYSTQAGISTCINYIKYLNESSPDNQIDFINNSFSFIADFCIQKNISVDAYPRYKSLVQYDCVKHLKEHKISVYVIFGIPEIYSILHNMPKDEFSLYFGESFDLNELNQKYNTSEKAKSHMRKLLILISSYVEKHKKKDK